MILFGQYTTAQREEALEDAERLVLEFVVTLVVTHAARSLVLR